MMKLTWRIFGKLLKNFLSGRVFKEVRVLTRSATGYSKNMVCTVILLVTRFNLPTVFPVSLFQGGGSEYYA